MVEKTSIRGWEQEINRGKIKIRQGYGYEQDVIRQMEENHQKKENTLKEGWKIWNEWDQQRKKVRQMVERDKREKIKQIINEIGRPEGPENIWKAIDRIVPRAHRTTNALEKEEGGVCMDEKEEIEAIQNYCKRHLGKFGRRMKANKIT